MKTAKTYIRHTRLFVSTWSRNKREGKYLGKLNGRHNRSNWRAAWDEREYRNRKQRKRIDLFFKIVSANKRRRQYVGTVPSISVTCEIK